MMMGQAGQASFPRHGNIAGAEIKYDQTKATGAKKFSTGAANASSMDQANDGQRRHIGVALGPFGRQKVYSIQ